MNNHPNEVVLCGALSQLLENGVIAVDPDYCLWKSGVYAVIDCVFSAQAKYESVVLPMLRERLPARQGMVDKEELRFSDFIADVDSFGSDKWDAYGSAVLNLQVLARRRKVEVCHDIAHFFVSRNLETMPDLRALGEPALVELVLGPLQSQIHGIGPALARYLAILFGVESQIKPDTLIIRFFDALSAWSPRAGNEGDIALIEGVMRESADQAGTTPSRLDNAIWLFMTNGGDPKSHLAETNGAIESGPVAQAQVIQGVEETGPQRFERINYENLNSRQKESYNFQKLAGELADFGFTCMLLHDDWEGADFLAVHVRGNSVLKVQLKGRLTVADKYEGKDLWIAFPHEGAWYLVEHDVLVAIVGETTPWLASQSWANGEYSSAKPSKALMHRLFNFRLSSHLPVHEADQGEVQAIEKRFHELIRHRAGHLEGFDSLQLPSLHPIMRGRIWFPIPGMYGGFNYEFEVIEGELTLQTESGSRVGGGSFQDHHISAVDCKLIRDGYL